MRLFISGILLGAFMGISFIIVGYCNYKASKERERYKSWVTERLTNHEDRLVELEQDGK